METLIQTWQIWVWIIGMPISIAIIEHIDGEIEPIHFFHAMIWPIWVVFYISAMILYPIYWLTKKLITIYKSY